MPRKLFEQFALVAASVLAMLVMWASPLADVETGFGLRTLYAVRGTRPAPPDVVIVALDSSSAVALGLRNRPSLWPRRLHAQLINGLKARGARVIGVDLLFDRARDSVDDALLAESLRAAGNVVLVESVTREAIKTPQGEVLASMDRLVQPLPQFEQAALATAPFVLPKTPTGVFAFWSFLPNAGDQPSMPLVLSLPMMATEYTELVRAWRMASSDNPAVHSPLVATPEAALISVPELLRALRATFNADALMLENDTAQLAQASPRVQTLLRLLAAREQHALNLYGPIGTIKTVPYRDALRLVADASGDKTFRDKAVLIGYSEFNQPEQKDAYATPFTTSDGLDISGVELCATALANLLDGSTLRRLSDLQTLLLLIVWSAALILPWLMQRTHYAALLTLALVLAYAVAANYSFAAHRLWLPVVVTLVFQPLIVAGLGLGWHVLRAYRKQRELRQQIKAHVIAQE